MNPAWVYHFVDVKMTEPFHDPMKNLGEVHVWFSNFSMMIIHYVCYKMLLVYVISLFGGSMSAIRIMNLQCPGQRSSRWGKQDGKG